MPRRAGKLQHLETLNVSHNSLEVLPVQLGRLASLKVFEVHSNGGLLGLPVSLAKLQFVESLKCDARHVDPARYDKGPARSAFFRFLRDLDKKLFLSMGVDNRKSAMLIMPAGD
jgi:hypothetical protein